MSEEPPTSKERMQNTRNRRVAKLANPEFSPRVLFCVKTASEYGFICKMNTVAPPTSIDEHNNKD